MHNCDIETAQKIARALGVSVAYLFTETDQLAEPIDEFGKLSGKAQEALLLEVRRKASRWRAPEPRLYSATTTLPFARPLST